MHKAVTLNLSKVAFERAEGLAAVLSRSVEEVLSETLEVTLPDIQAETMPPISSLPDEEVLALAHNRMESKQSRRYSELLDRQQAGKLSEKEQKELSSLFQIYLHLWLKQSEALAEAVKRGIHPPLST